MAKEYNLKIDAEFIVQVVLIFVLSMVIVYNLGNFSISGGEFSILPGVSASSVIPNGDPKLYGEELGIRYDDVSPNDPRKADATIAVLKKLDLTINLEGENLKRYIGITTQISCEYCCGAKAIVFENGQPACGCAHSYAMRGLAKYLITNHGAQYTDDQILEELGKWKVLFFPGIHETKASVLKSQGIDFNYINLASNKYRGIEKGQAAAGNAMVGGC